MYEGICADLQQAPAHHVFHPGINAPIQVDAVAIEEEAAEVIVQGSLHVQIQLPQGPPCA